MLDLSKIPVTNLYIFLTLLGVGLFAFSLSYPLSRVHQNTLEFAAIQRDEQMLDLDRNVEFGKIVRERYDHPVENGYLVKSSLQELRGQDGEFTKRGLELERRKIELTYRKKVHDADFEQISVLLTPFNLLAVLGFLFIVTGFAGWLVRVQRYQDLKLKNSATGGDENKRPRLRTLHRFN